MNTQKTIILWILAGALALLAAGCGSSSNGGGSGSSSNLPGPSTNTNGYGSGGTTSGVNQFIGQSGAAVAMTIDSVQALTSYVGYSHALNAPTGYALHVNLTNNGSGQWGGNINITYLDNGHWYTSTQITGTGTVKISGNNWYNGFDNAAFNQWFNFGGQKVFHGFFQDALGAIILVLDSTGTGSGDGLSSGTYNGSVWFKNFNNPANAVQSENMCWFIEDGPFDCQTFMVGGRVNTTSALYPSTGDGYTRLGTFKGLNIKGAFNQ